MCVVADSGVSCQAIHNLKKDATDLPMGVIPQHKFGLGRKNKTSSKIDEILKGGVLSHPVITTATLKEKYPIYLGML